MKQEQQLAEALEKLHKLIKSRTSYTYRIISGLLTGAATAIGATLIAGFVLYILSLFFKRLDVSSIPLLDHLSEQVNILSEQQTIN